MMLYEAAVMGAWMLLTFVDLYRRIGPLELRARADVYDQLGVLSQFGAFVYLIVSDGLLLHWQVGRRR